MEEARNIIIFIGIFFLPVAVVSLIPLFMKWNRKKEWFKEKQNQSWKLLSALAVFNYLGLVGHFIAERNSSTPSILAFDTLPGYFVTVFIGLSLVFGWVLTYTKERNAFSLVYAPIHLACLWLTNYLMLTIVSYGYA
ncbi:hypothetical protein [Puniceicoccus vermicola]|uniref:Uncharacterized protein n=1 Tax=Puniceicoccus vermicola TaxID=388746 RepID=A0A7X1E477_9BACT|nr:hypothetical protein [Puniceicoccus vermicola]MBC2601698.1 hypothetical protein [Puniceicoccus vermicola]